MPRHAAAAAQKPRQRNRLQRCWRRPLRLPAARRREAGAAVRRLPPRPPCRMPLLPTLQARPGQARQGQAREDKRQAQWAVWLRALSIKRQRPQQLERAFGSAPTCGGGLAAVPEVHTQRPAPVQLQQEQH